MAINTKKTWDMGEIQGKSMEHLWEIYGKSMGKTMENLWEIYVENIWKYLEKIWNIGGNMAKYMGKIG